MKKTVFNFIALLTVLATLLAACTTPTPATVVPATAAPATAVPATQPPAADDSGKVEIRWYVGLGTGGDPEQQETQKQVVEDFNKSHDKIKLVLEIVTYNAAYDTLATEAASGNPPDVVGPVGVSGAEAFHGQWLDMASLVAAAKYDLTQFDQGAVNFYKTKDEGQVGLPFAVYPSVLYFQKGMFDEAGLNYPPQKYGEKYKWADGTEEEWNFETLTKVAMKLTVDKNNKDAADPAFDPKNIVQYGYIPQYQDARAMGSYWAAGSLVAADGKTAQIPEAWAAAWKWIYDGTWKQHFIPDNAVIQSEQFGATNPFNSGRIAMALTHLWYTCCIENAGQTWDIAVVPSCNGKVTANLNADTFRILKASKHPAEAFEVVRYLNDEASLKLLGIYGGMPARLSDQDAFFKGLDEKFPQKPNWQVALDSMQYFDQPSFEGWMPNYQEAQDRVTNVFTTLMQTTDGLNMDDEIAKLKTDLQTIFDKKK